MQADVGVPHVCVCGGVQPSCRLMWAHLIWARTGSYGRMWARGLCVPCKRALNLSAGGCLHHEGFFFSLMWGPPSASCEPLLQLHVGSSFSLVRASPSASCEPLVQLHVNPFFSLMWALLSASWGLLLQPRLFDSNRAHSVKGAGDLEICPNLCFGQKP
eukprot:365298-Chlamydomonas_euryale.AAC.2